MRGADVLFTPATPGRRGSSPLARGRPSSLIELFQLGRIIPACAGPTGRRCGTSCAAWDHPRLRGADRPPAPVDAFAGGSSPLARGRRHDVENRNAVPGIIPACAGPTVGAVEDVRQRGDHPRLRGADRDGHTDIIASTGSSPLARGRRCTTTSPGSPNRIIPACAGPTPARRRTDRRHEDHPRLRGAD